MSWSVNAKGSRDEVRKTVGESLDSSARNMTTAGLREGNDLLVLRAVILGAIDTLTLADGDTVDVECYGSRSEGSYMSATLKVAIGPKAA